MRELYELHGDGCGCPIHLADGDSVFDTKFKKIAPTIEADFMKQVWDKKLDATTLHQDLFAEHFTRLRGAAMQGYGRYFSKPRSMDEAALFQKMTQNAAQLSTAKQQAMIEEMRDLMTDASGKLRPRADWERTARGVMARHNGQYLKAEIEAASASASSAENWQEYQKAKKVYPNLRYETVGDSKVRDEHAALDGAVYPIDHPFWDTWMPPNGWNCRCMTVLTDEEENQLAPEKDPPKGFANNPGKTGKLFADDHPYFTRAKSKARLFEKGDLMRERITRDEVADFMAENVVSKKKDFTLPGGETFRFWKRDVMNVLAHPHKGGAAKNELLYAIAHALKNAVFLGSAPNTDPAKNQSLGWLYFLVEWLDQTFVLNMERIKMPDGSTRIRLYSIKEDNPDLPE